MGNNHKNDAYVSNGSPPKNVRNVAEKIRDCL